MYSLPAQGVEIKLIFALRAAIFEIRANFQNFHIWAWNMEFEDRSQSCKYILSVHPRGSKVSLFLLYGQSFSRYGPICKISIFGYEIWNSKKGPKVQYVLSTPRGLKMGLFLLYGQHFSRYGPICKISIFGHEIWNLKKGKLHMYSLSTPGRWKWAYFCSTGNSYKDMTVFHHN